MSIKAAFAIPFAKFVQKRVYKVANHAVATQDKVFNNLVDVARNTAFGRDHNF